MNFSQYLDTLKSHARVKMSQRIFLVERDASIQIGMGMATPKFSDEDKERLCVKAEEDAVGRVFAMLRKAAFPDECE